MKRHELTDEQWESIELLLPKSTANGLVGCYHASSGSLLWRPG